MTFCHQQQTFLCLAARLKSRNFRCGGCTQLYLGNTNFPCGGEEKKKKQNYDNGCVMIDDEMNEELLVYLSVIVEIGLFTHN